MVHFLRNSKNRTIVECEVYNNDLHSSTDIEIYSKMLLSLDDEKKYLFIQHIARLDELRGVWWENIETSQSEQTMEEFVTEEFERVGKYWDLNYVTD